MMAASTFLVAEVAAQTDERVPLQGDHRVLWQGNNRLVIVEPEGGVSWEIRRSKPIWLPTKRTGKSASMTASQAKWYESSRSRCSADRVNPGMAPTLLGTVCSARSDWRMATH
jgi:hypothetical protein